MTSTPEDISRFWNLIESAWTATGTAPSTALRSADGDLGSRLDAFLAQLSALSADFSSADLTALDRVAERALYDIDRADIQAVTDGSDDGFLYARGFIVAMGRDYYEAVNADPEAATTDAECEEMCYFFAHLHHARFGAFPETGSGISRETASNPAGWS
ncbi:DUF4240 domain-containing protein [Nocardia alba]|uniref:DUF4240 domain-containing protein n=1 Tax=Nocardia alba TaxID=225051 RepID=UPI001A9F2890|nr:DUF4240 domain-containing protein [Nocardia alba]